MPHPGRSSLTGRTARSQTAQCACPSGTQYSYLRVKVILSSWHANITGWPVECHHCIIIFGYLDTSTPGGGLAVGAGQPETTDPEKRKLIQQQLYSVVAACSQVPA